MGSLLPPVSCHMDDSYCLMVVPPFLRNNILVINSEYWFPSRPSPHSVSLPIIGIISVIKVQRIQKKNTNNFVIIYIYITQLLVN